MILEIKGYALFGKLSPAFPPAMKYGIHTIRFINSVLCRKRASIKLRIILWITGNTSQRFVYPLFK